MKISSLIHRRTHSANSASPIPAGTGHDRNERQSADIVLSPPSSSRQALVRYLRLLEEEENRNAASHLQHLQDLILRHQQTDHNHPSSSNSTGRFGPLMPSTADPCRADAPVSSDALSRLPRARILPMDKERFECDDTQCSICCSRLVDGIMLTRTPCGHVYHVTCLIPWLLHRNTCPDCRYELPSAGSSVSEEVARKERMQGRNVYRCSCVQKGIHSCFFADPARSLADQCKAATA